MIFLSTVRHAPRPARLRAALSCVLVVAALAAAVSAPAQDAASSGAALPPVTVTAPRFAERAVDLPYGVSVVTADEIRASGATTVNEAVMKLLGVVGRLDFYGGGDYGLDLRGFGGTADNNQVVVVDGIRISEADLGGTRLAGIAIDSVERIEVIRGSAALLYGEGATGGAVLITTRAGSGSARANQASVYDAAGSYGVRELRGAATIAAGAWSLDAALSRRDADNHRDNFRSRSDGGALALQWRGDGLRAGVRHATDHLDTGLPGALSTAQYEADPRRTTTPLDAASIRNTRSSVFGEATFGAWQFGVDAGVRRKSLTSSNAGFDYDYDIDAGTVALRAKLVAQTGAIAHGVVAGVDHGQWERTVRGAFGSVSNQRSQAVYLKDDVLLPGGTRLSAGVRSERVHKDGGGASIDQHPHAWEVGALQPLPMAGVALFGRIGRSFRVANVDEIGFTAPGATLATQTSRDLELGARWSHAGGRAELRVYRSALTDEIGFDPNAVGPFGPGANVNFDPTRREGVELEVAQALGSGVDVRVNAAVRRARFSAGVYAGRDVPLTPRHTLALRAGWVPAPGHRLDAGVNLVASQHPDFDNACRMPRYTTADLRYAYQWGVAELAFGVANLTDARYYTLAFACANGAVTSIYPEAGRALSASLRLRF